MDKTKKAPEGVQRRQEPQKPPKQQGQKQPENGRTDRWATGTAEPEFKKG